MKVSLPITKVLHASGSLNGKPGLLKLLASQQQPLDEVPSGTGVGPWDHHQGQVRGSFENWYHSATFSIGTPPQAFNAILHLGSSSLNVPSIHNPISNRTSKPLYDSSASSSYIPNGTIVSEHPLFFGNNSGFLSQEVFNIAGLTVRNQVFTEVTSPDFGSCFFCTLFDTVLPLGPYNADSESNSRSPIAQLVEQKLLDENVFSLRLSRGVTDTDGTIVLGGAVDENLYEGDFTTIPVINHLLGELPCFPSTIPDCTAEDWKVHVSSFTLGDGSAIHYDFSSSTIASLDTAYPWIALPCNLTDSLNRIMDGDTWGPFTWVDCSRRREFDDVTIVLEGQKFVLSPFDYVLEQEYEDEPGRLYCQSAFVPAFRDGPGGVLLGNAFLRAFVTVWDLEGKSVSFAKAKHSDNSQQAE